ncbi:MAG: methyltransferase domain-containing protein [Candidatus Freyarchaeum deiterrae]
MNNKYTHGYSERESERLYDQANTLADLLHHDTVYPQGSRVLEAGCGVGAQTAILAKNSPDSEFTSIDISQDSLNKARDLIDKENITNVHFRQADIFALPFEEERFDHVFVCFVLEHLQEPVRALIELRKVLKTAGSLTVIEGDHGSCYFHPETREAIIAWRCLIQVQTYLKGNSLIGRQLFPLLNKADLQKINVSPRVVYADSSKPELVDGFVRKTIIPMVEGVKKQALELKLIDKSSWDKGIRDLNKVAESPDGTFCYTFFKGIGIK